MTADPDVRRRLKLMPWGLLTPDDFKLAQLYIGGGEKFLPRKPDVIIAPEGEPYIYRWHLTPRNYHGNVYFHIQVLSDPERPYHDHPWDNTSVILAGGYYEAYQISPPHSMRLTRTLGPGSVVHRKAEESHRLFLREGQPYSMSLFVTGPHRRRWGFWITGSRGTPEWVDEAKVIELRADGTSVYTGPTA